MLLVESDQLGRAQVGEFRMKFKTYDDVLFETEVKAMAIRMQKMFFSTLENFVDNEADAYEIFSTCCSIIHNMSNLGALDPETEKQVIKFIDGLNKMEIPLMDDDGTEYDA